ncbi:MAG: Maf family protein [Chloroflexota bacterium]
MTAELILASASPRRRELLAQTGLTFRIIPSEFDEQAASADSPAALAELLACGKARDVARRLEAGVVIGADTIVVRAGEVLGKPHDDADASRMLRRLSGGWHEVITGVAVIDAATGRERSGAEVTRVKVRDLTAGDVEAYVASGEPRDKAGAYAIQGLGSLLIERIDGCYANVVGLPIFRLAAMLREFGIDPLLQSLPTNR